ncbi:DsbA family oxidoreductase [Sesbania bispinosa]|nr:DsbA family oxidoreductase [Sesbania bispinosa]
MRRICQNCSHVGTWCLLLFHIGKVLIAGFKRKSYVVGVGFKVVKLLYREATTERRSLPTSSPPQQQQLHRSRQLAGDSGNNAEEEGGVLANPAGRSGASGAERSEVPPLALDYTQGHDVVEPSSNQEDGGEDWGLWCEQGDAQDCG